MMLDLSKVVLETLTEPEDTGCKMFSKEYYRDMTKRFNIGK